MNTADEAPKRVTKRKAEQQKPEAKRQKSAHEKAYDESAEFRIALELQDVLKQFIEARTRQQKIFDVTIWDYMHEESIEVILDLMFRFGFEPNGEEEMDEPYRIITFVARKW